MSLWIQFRRVAAYLSIPIGECVQCAVQNETHSAQHTA